MTTPLKISERFCAADADVTIASSDGLLFKVHRKNLELHSDVFAGAEATTRPENGDEMIHLTETSDVLDLLFQYMYRQPQPNLKTVDFKTLAALTEGAEKYVVYSALTLCRMYMSDAIPEHPLEVLVYAVKHGQEELIDEAARRSMGRSFTEVMNVLPQDILKTWILFYERWHQAELDLFVRMLSYGDTSQVDLGRRCLQNRTPVYTFLKDLERLGYAGMTERIMAMKFLPDISADQKQEQDQKTGGLFD